VNESNFDAIFAFEKLNIYKGVAGSLGNRKIAVPGPAKVQLAFRVKLGEFTPDSIF
jgi:hypothetical protein